VKRETITFASLPKALSESNKNTSRRAEADVLAHSKILIFLEIINLFFYFFNGSFV